MRTDDQALPALRLATISLPVVDFEVTTAQSEIRYRCLSAGSDLVLFIRAEERELETAPGRPTWL
jgi:hypothetical protein